MSDEQAKAVAAAVSDTAKYLIRWAAGIGIGVFVLGWCVPGLYRADAEVAEREFEEAYDLGYKTGLVSSHCAPGYKDGLGVPRDGPVCPYIGSNRTMHWRRGYADGQVVKAGMPKERK